MEGIVKRFVGVTALDHVDVEVRRGEVHAIVGENGAGKSTLIKIMSGAYHRDAGTMWLGDDPVNFATPADACRAGIVAVHQEVHVLPHLTVAENVFLGREPRRWGVLRWRRMFDDTTRLFADLGIDVDSRAELGTLRTAQQQLVAIARGVSLGAKVLVLDEPTSALAEREVALLFALIRRLTADGTAVIYVSHRLDELYDICDRVTVLRDGRRVATHLLTALDRLDLVCLMLGQSRDELAMNTARHESLMRALGHEATPLFRAVGLQCGARVRDVSLDIQRGEIVGLAGLLGAGRSETARTVFGVDPVDAGAMTLHDAPYAPMHPRDAIAARVAFLPEDRKVEGIIPELSVRENMTLAALPTLTRMGIVSRTRQRELVDMYMRRFGIKATHVDQPVRELSGGNQQKVLLARWLCTRPELFIIDEPTRGIDVGARAEIQALVYELAADGLAVLMISSDLDELIDGSSRVVVLRDGRTVAVVDREVLSQPALAHGAILHAMADESVRHAAAQVNV